jgi:hypothetical protein
MENLVLSCPATTAATTTTTTTTILTFIPLSVILPLATYTTYYLLVLHISSILSTKVLGVPELVLYKVCMYYLEVVGSIVVSKLLGDTTVL